MYRKSTGEIVGPWVTYFTYPFRHWYSALAALTYFVDASRFDGVPPDPRLADVIEAVRAARTEDGVWLQPGRPEGAQWFEVDDGPGKPSPWITFYALRALRWWDDAH